MTEKEWAESLNKCDDSLKSLKDFAKNISQDRANWQKFSDDSKRLWAAYTALAIAITSLLATQIPALYRWITGDEPVHRFSFVCHLNPKTSVSRCDGASPP
jgi:hypothetical protein